MFIKTLSNEKKSLSYRGHIPKYQQALLSERCKLNSLLYE